MSVNGRRRFSCSKLWGKGLALQERSVNLEVKWDGLGLLTEMYVDLKGVMGLGSVS